MSNGNYKRRRITLSDTSAHQLGLGAPYALVEGYNTFSNADTSASIAVVDADGKTILTVGSGDFTNTTGKDGVEKVLAPEGPTGKGVTEDGTDAVTNTLPGGVWAKSPLTVTASGIDATEYLNFEVYVKTNVKRRRITLADTSAHDLLLGVDYARVIGYNVLSNADTSASIATADDDGKVIFTVASGDFTNTTGKDGVEFTLFPEAAVTEDGTAATVNSGVFRGVWTKSPLTLTASGIDATEYLVVDVLVEV